MHPIVLVLVICAAATAQAPETRAASRPETRRVSDEKAVQIFKNALSAQTAGGPAIRIRDFQAELQVISFDTDPKTKARVPHSARVIEAYRDRGKDEPLFRRELIDDVQKNDTIQGFDGNHYWQRLGNAPPRDLSRGRENADDRKRIKDESARTQDFLRLLLLSNYDGPDVTFRYAGIDSVTTNRRVRSVEKIVREHPSERPIELFIGDSEGGSVLFGISRQLDSGHVEKIGFAVHKIVKSEGASALVPLFAEYYEDGVKTFEAQAKSQAQIKFNTGIPDGAFAMMPR